MYSATSAKAVVIWEFEVPAKDTSAGPGDAAAYRTADYEAWLVEAGFNEVRVSRSVTSPGNVLLTARA